MTDYVVKPLDANTWDGFAGLAQRHNGVFGAAGAPTSTRCTPRRRSTPTTTGVSSGILVEEGQAHAALVYDGDEAVAWCEYGSPEELPNIYHKQYEEELDLVPDYRITLHLHGPGLPAKGAVGRRAAGVPST